MNEQNDKELRRDEQRSGIPWWFLAGSILVFLWSIYYIYRYWGGLGPGIGY